MKFAEPRLVAPPLSPELKELSTAYAQVYQQPNKNKRMARLLMNLFTNDVAPVKLIMGSDYFRF